MENNKELIEEAKKPGAVYCPECDEELSSPMDKLSIGLYGKCSIHLEDDKQIADLITLAEEL